MERISIIENFFPKNDPALLQKAEDNLPTLLETELVPVSFAAPTLAPGETVRWDFGTHCVGYLTLQLSFSGSHPDAPALLRLRFAERLEEFMEDASAYHGWISKGWIAEELLHVDRLPFTVSLPRRYAFRYLECTVIDTSRKFRLVVDRVWVRAVSAVDPTRVTPLERTDPKLCRIDAVAIKTLAECMQEVFEDGPKRDRRLWLGDFRLQALVNGVTFRNFALVKRCLYLFAGTRFPDDRIAACLFTDGEPAADDTWFSDYALLYPVALAEYLALTDDSEALRDLYDVAVAQLDRALAMTDADGIVNADFVDAAFIDWSPGLEKTASTMGVLLYALPYGRVLAQKNGDALRDAIYAEALERGRAAAKTRFWDPAKGVFVSNGQISPASQIWMTLGGVLPEASAKGALCRLLSEPSETPLVAPYLHHYALEALLSVGKTDAAMEHLLSYWGGMVDRGADTFWEIWNPEAPDASPYGGTIVNSYCHAWSCTPSYFLRNHLL